MEQIECSETSAYKIQTPGNYPEENIQRGQWILSSLQEHKNSEYVFLINWIQLTLDDLQLDAQNLYLFTYNTFIKILYMFRALPCSSSGGLRRNCIYVASGIATICRWLSCAPVKNEFFASIWKSTKVILRCTVNQPSRFVFSCLLLILYEVKKITSYMETRWVRLSVTQYHLLL
jgi:hypothetical protein